MKFKLFLKSIFSKIRFILNPFNREVCLIKSTFEIITKIETSCKKDFYMFQNFGLPQSTSIGKLFSDIHF